VAENETLGTTQWVNTVGIAGLIVALSAPLVGAVADQGGRRKPWIGLFTLMCVLATAALWWIRPDTGLILPAKLLAGLATLFAFGGVYAAETFGMDEEQVLLFGIALNVTAGLGAAAFAWIDDWLGSKQTILVSLIGFVMMVSVPATGRSGSPTNNP
jgi:MFS-type transporter involved in bile tolerance (Atg22 family)